MDDGNSVTTKLLTLLNVSATKIGKRKWTYEDLFEPPAKLNKRKSASFIGSEVESAKENGKKTDEAGVEMETEVKNFEETEKDEVDQSMSQSYARVL